MGIRMQTLELKVPPPVVPALVAGAMWGIAALAPLVDVPATVRVPGAVVLALIGAAFDMSGVIAFRRRQTTVNPRGPKRRQPWFDRACTG